MPSGTGHRSGSGIFRVGQCGQGPSGPGRKTLPAEERQAAASVGQAALMHAYENLLAQAGVHCGQILLTQDNFKDRKRRKKAYPLSICLQK